MTAQIRDCVQYKETIYSIQETSGSGLFTPHSIGITPVMISTACHRGFYSKYRIDEETLFLNELYLGLDDKMEKDVEAKQGGAIFGKYPERYGYYTFESEVPTWRVSSEFRCIDLHEPIPFSGGLLVVKDFVSPSDSSYPSFCYAWQYRSVFEFLFESGKLLKVNDCSSVMEKVRDAIDDLSFANEAADVVIKKSITDSFKYEYKSNAIWSHELRRRLLDHRDVVLKLDEVGPNRLKVAYEITRIVGRAGLALDIVHACPCDIVRKGYHYLRQLEEMENRLADLGAKVSLVRL